MTATTLAHPIGIPASQSTVSVKILNAARATGPANLFLTPVLPEFPNLDAGPCFCFLIEHTGTGKRIVFDLGVRKDPVETSTPANQAMLRGSEGIKPPFEFVVEKDVATQLTEGGVDLETISAIIWSHAHSDHTGDPTTFPSTTDLVVGPGFTANLLPAYPTNPASGFFEKDIAGRKLVEISFDDAAHIISGLRTHDYFSDGSFYLLDTPGHCHGHMTGLARVTAGDKPTFILLGADSCHHPAQLRPSPHHPAPAHLRPLLNSFGIDPATPPLAITTGPGGIHTDATQAIRSLERLQALDGEDDVFVIIAHDISLLGTVEMFPEEANGWKAQGWKEKSAWSFLEEGNPAFRFKVVIAH